MAGQANFGLATSAVSRRHSYTLSYCPIKLRAGWTLPQRWAGLLPFPQEVSDPTSCCVSLNPRQGLRSPTRLLREVVTTASTPLLKMIILQRPAPQSRLARLDSFAQDL